jgi:hypothetical protein
MPKILALTVDLSRPPQRKPTSLVCQVCCYPLLEWQLNGEARAFAFLTLDLYRSAVRIGYPF